jgi:hypothetical protein
VHYPGTHPLGTEDQFARGLEAPPLVYSDTCRLLNSLTFSALSCTWLGIFSGFIDPGGPLGNIQPCEGLEGVVRSIFEGRIIKDSFELRLFDATTGSIGEHTVYADLVQPSDPGYAPIRLAGNTFAIQEYDFPTNCYWYASHDVAYFHFQLEAFIRGCFISYELQPGVKRIFAMADTNPPIHVPPTGGDLGITVSSLSFLSPGFP